MLALNGFLYYVSNETVLIKGGEPNGDVGTIKESIDGEAFRIQAHDADIIQMNDTSFTTHPKEQLNEKLVCFYISDAEMYEVFLYSQMR